MISINLAVLLNILKFLCICRYGIMRWSLINYPSVLALLVKTDTTIGTGFSGVKEGFLLKVQIPENGATTAPKKR